MYPPHPRWHFRAAQDIPEPSRAVRNAVRLMLAGAGLEVAKAVVAVTTEDSLRPPFGAGARSKVGTAELHAIVVAHGQDVAITSLVAAALWLGMAWANHRAVRGARDIAGVPFGLYSIGLVPPFRDLPTLAVSIVIWLAGLAAMVLLFDKECTLAGRRFKGPVTTAVGGGPDEDVRVSP